MALSDAYPWSWLHQAVPGLNVPPADVHVHLDSGPVPVKVPSGQCGPHVFWWLDGCPAFGGEHGGPHVSRWLDGCPALSPPWLWRSSLPNVNVAEWRLDLLHISLRGGADHAEIRETPPFR